MMDTIFAILGVIWQIYVNSCVVFTSLVLFGMYLKHKETKPTTSTTQKTDSNKLNETDTKKLVIIEKVDGKFMMFDAHTTSFISQGSTLSEVNANAKIRFPSTNFVPITTK